MQLILAAGQPDLVPVTLWTLTAVGISMLVLTLAYLYRRTRGDQDELIPTEVVPYEGTPESEHHESSQSAGH
jgi:hypothetical protein